MTTDPDEQVERPKRPYYGPTDTPKAHTISWRVESDDYAGVYLPFFAAFGDRKASTAMRWLMERPEVRMVINAKIREGIAE